MNLIGKIFTVLIFVMSVTFMAFTVMSYATRTNWRKVADNPTPSLEQPHGGLSQQLADERNKNQKLQDANEKVKPVVGRARGGGPAGAVGLERKTLASTS